MKHAETLFSLKFLPSQQIWLRFFGRVQILLDGTRRENMKRHRQKGCLPSTAKPAKPSKKKNAFQYCSRFCESNWQSANLSSKTCTEAAKRYSINDFSKSAKTRKIVWSTKEQSTLTILSWIMPIFLKNSTVLGGWYHWGRNGTSWVLVLSLL